MNVSTPKRSQNMVSHKIQLLCVGMLMAFLISNSQITYAAKADDDAKGGKANKPPEVTPTEPYKAVTEFCNQRRTSEDRAFCVRVLKSSPVSASAQDNVSLLKIAIDLAVGNAKKTKDYFTTLSNSKGTKPALIPVLKECISAYDDTITQLLLITQDLLDDPPMGSYDAHQANEDLSTCENSLRISKVADDAILSRVKISAAYGRLVEEISKSI